MQKEIYSLSSTAVPKLPIALMWIVEEEEDLYGTLLSRNQVWVIFFIVNFILLSEL